MAINTRQLREYVIQPALQIINLYSLGAEELLVLTAAQESHSGTYLHQLGRGPACGIFQMEPATHDDIYSNYLVYKKKLLSKVQSLDLQILGGTGVGSAQEMCGNLYYAAAMCRVHYLRVKEPLPAHTDLNGLAKYWKDHYNTFQGAGTAAEAISNYNRFVQ